MNLLRLHRASGRLLRGGRIRRVATSVSDNDTYPQFCLDAAADYGVFETFRRERVYTKSLEHVTREQGEEYLSLLSEDRSLLEAMPSSRGTTRSARPCCTTTRASARSRRRPCGT